MNRINLCITDVNNKVFSGFTPDGIAILPRIKCDEEFQSMGSNKAILDEILRIFTKDILTNVIKEIDIPNVFENAYSTNQHYCYSGRSSFAHVQLATSLPCTIPSCSPYTNPNYTLVNFHFWSLDNRKLFFPQDRSHGASNESCDLYRSKSFVDWVAKKFAEPGK